MRSFHTAVIGVADLDRALSLWIDQCGFELREQRSGPDTKLAKLWDIEATDITRQAIVASPGADTGMLHFVEFNEPQSPVRENANTFDTCPKNLDIYVHDMPEQMTALKAAGYKFRSKNYTQIVTDDGVEAKEIHMVGHDDINVVLLERDIPGVQFSEQGFAGIGPLITAVSNIDLEKSFYANVLEINTLEHYDMHGPDIEKMIGLPKGAGIHFSILGHPDAPLGRIEVISYDGTNGNNLFTRAKPKNLGILHITYMTENLSELKAALTAHSLEWTEHGTLRTLSASGDWVSFYSPAGFRIECVKV